MDKKEHEDTRENIYEEESISGINMYLACNRMVQTVLCTATWIHGWELADTFSLPHTLSYGATIKTVKY